MMLLLVALLVEEPSKPVHKEVGVPKATLYVSAQGYAACLSASAAELEARVAAFKRPESFTRLQMKMAVEKRVQTCDTATVATLSEGAAVEVSSNPGPCAVPDGDKTTPQLARVRLTTGEKAGAVGCVVASWLRDPVVF